MHTIPRTGKRVFAAVLALGAIGVLVAPTLAQAHFVLTSPPAWMSQDSMGIPEKLGPCGDELDGTDAATPSNIVTAYQQGQMITVTVNEVIFHPGHYRISLAVNDRSELPAEPLVEAGTTPCGSAPIQSPPVFPVLADGVFVHTQPFTGPQSIQITLPSNVTCTKCTLQVIEFMAEHPLNMPGGCFYHHCADLSIQSGDSGNAMTASSDSGNATLSTPDSGGAASSVDASGTQTQPGTDDSGSGTAGTAAKGSSSGCSLATGRAATGVDCFGGFIVAGVLARRRGRRRGSKRPPRS